MLGGAPYLSGIKPDQMQVIEDAATERFKPEVFRARRDALKGLQRLTSSRASFERGVMPRLHRRKADADEKSKLNNTIAVS